MLVVPGTPIPRNTKDIERIQRRAARFVKGCFEQEVETVSNLLNELEWSHELKENFMANDLQNS